MGKVRFAVQRLSLALALFLSLSSPVQAQAQQAQELALAQALFEQGFAAAESGDWKVACDRFEESNRLDPAPGTMMNIGRCRAQLGELVRAWESYKQAAEVFGTDDPRAQFASNEALKLERRVPQVTLTPPVTDTPFAVIVEGTPVAIENLGVALPYDPGTVEIIVRARGHEDRTQQLRLEEGVRVEHQLALGAVLSGSTNHAPPVSTAPATGGLALTERSHARAKKPADPAVVTSFAVGGVGLALGVFGGVWAAVESPTVKTHCDDDLNCDRAGFEAAKRGRIATILGVSGAGLALVGISMGTVLLVTKQDTSLSLVPMVGGTMLSFQGKL